MKVCITGGAGFIGSHLAEYFQGRAEVTVLDDLSTGYRRNLDGLDVTFLHGSILDRAAVRRAVTGADYVFHLAAMVSVPLSMEQPLRCVELNTTGLLIVLEEAARAGVRKLCFSSSAAIYGNNPSVPKTEDMLPEPCSPYGISKLSGEYYCSVFTQARGLPTACLRYFNVFGPRQDPNSAYAAVVPIFIHNALRNEPLTIFGDGLQTRDFIYVKDIAAANAFLAEHSEHTGVYNVAYGGRMTIRELAERIIRLTDSRSEIRFAPERPGDVRHSSASVAKLASTGFRPSADFDAGLAETIAFFQSVRKA